MEVNVGKYFIVAGVLFSFSIVTVAAEAVTVQDSKVFDAKKTKKPVKKALDEGFVVYDPGVYAY